MKCSVSLCCEAKIIKVGLEFDFSKECWRKSRASSSKGSLSSGGLPTTSALFDQLSAVSDVVDIPSVDDNDMVLLTLMVLLEPLF